SITQFADCAFFCASKLSFSTSPCAASRQSLLMIASSEQRANPKGARDRPRKFPRGTFVHEATKMMEIPDLLRRAFADRVTLPLRDTARLLGIDQKTLRAHVKAGNIRFVVIGLGMTKLRREFTLSDILEFLERMRRRECRSTNAPTRPTTTMIS